MTDSETEKTLPLVAHGDDAAVYIDEDGHVEILHREDWEWSETGESDAVGRALFRCVRRSPPSG